MVTISPAGLAGTALTANELSILATYTERLCRSFCANSTVQPQASVVYSYGTPTLNGTTVFVPIIASISIVSTGCKCRAITQIFTEEFTVAFQDQTAVPTSVTITTTGRQAGSANVTCGRTSTYQIKDSLTVLIA